MSKFTNLNNLNKLSKALDARCKELVNEEKARALAEEQALQAEINVTKDMFGGKSIRYVTQAEYDALTEEEKDSSEITYFITDAVDLSHDHENKEFLDNLAARNIAIGNKSQSFDGVNDLVYSIEDIGAAPAEHSHDDKYYTESEIDLKLEDVNEAINGYVAELQSDIQTLESDKADKTYVDEQISNISNNGITEAELDLLLEEIFGINSKNELTSVRLGNYQMKYDNVNDTLDFLYNGAIEEPEVPPTTEEEIIPLVWAVGNLSGTDGSEKEQANSLRSSFAAIEDNYDYSFYLDTSFYDPSGVRVYFYDTNKTYISRTDGNVIGYVSGIYISIDVPTNAAYMRFKANASGTTSVDTIGSLFTLRKRKTAIVNNYVTDGLSLYIDATRGSINDITGNNTITNHGVTHTSDNNYLNFVASESDYLDTDFVPNLTQWSAEVYFQYTSMTTDSQAIFSWGVASDNNIRLAYSSSTSALTLQSNSGTNYPIISDSDEIVKPHHLIITKDNGTVITYLDGVKSVLVTDAAVQSPHDGTLNIGARYSPTKYFANMNLRTFRFYDGKVLTDKEALQNYNYETKINNYVTNGLSLYIDADDVATQGSIRDITGKQNIVNHGVSTTLDNGCLNFVASESDYIDCGFVPNLSTWSTEIYAYFTSTPADTANLYCWGSAKTNRFRVGYSGSDGAMKILVNSTKQEIGDIFLTLQHLVVTANNGTYIVYINGIQQYTFSADTLSSNTTNMVIGTSSYSTEAFADMNLKIFRHYDGKVLTDEEVLQNYNYEINRNIIKPTWIDGKSMLDNGNMVVNEQAVLSNFIKIDNSYNYTINYTDKVYEIRMVYYDSTGTYMSRSDYFTSGAVDTVVEFPENTAYVRIKAEKNGITVNEVNDNIIFKKVLK